MEDAFTAVHSCLVIQRAPLRIQELRKILIQLDCMPKFRDFGFPSLEQFLKSVPKVKIYDRGGDLYIEALSDKKSDHLAKLVQGQKSSKKRAPIIPKSKHYPFVYSRRSGSSARYQDENRRTYYSKDTDARHYQDERPSRHYQDENRKTYYSKDADTRYYQEERPSRHCQDENRKYYPDERPYGKPEAERYKTYDNNFSTRISEEKFHINEAVLTSSSKNGRLSRNENIKEDYTNLSARILQEEGNRERINSSRFLNDDKSNISADTNLKVTVGMDSQRQVSIGNGSCHIPTNGIDVYDDYYEEELLDEDEVITFNDSFEDKPVRETEREFDRMSLRSETINPSASSKCIFSSLRTPTALLAKAKKMNVPEYNMEFSEPTTTSESLNHETFPTKTSYGLPDKYFNSNSVKLVSATDNRTNKIHGSIKTNTSSKSIKLSKKPFLQTSNSLLLPVPLTTQSPVSSMEEETFDPLVRQSNEMVKQRKSLNSIDISLAAKMLIIKRVASIIQGCSSGYFAKNIVEEYLKRFGESLPKDWLEIIQRHSLMRQDSCIAGTIIFPATDVHVGQINKLHDVVYPDENSWGIFVTCSKSFSEVWFRIIDENFNGKYEQMADKMDNLYNQILDGTIKSINQVHVGSYYVVLFVKDWLRVQAKEIIGDKVRCFLIDHGDIDLFELNRLYPLFEQFAQLPPQAIMGSLNGLEKYDELPAINLLDTTINGNVFVANIISKFGNKVVMELFDTSGDEDININEALRAAIELELLPPSVGPVNKIVEEVALVSLLSNGEGVIQIVTKQLKFLRSLLKGAEQEIHCRPDAYKIRSFSEITVSNIYLLQYEDRSWHRILIKSVVAENIIEAVYIDYGNTEIIYDLTSIVNPDRLADALCRIPPQAVRVQLNKFNEENCTIDAISYIRNLTGDENPLVMKVIQISSNIPIVELYKRMPPNDELKSLSDIVLQLNVQTMTTDITVADSSGDEDSEMYKPLEKIKLKDLEIVEVFIVLVATPSNYAFHLQKYRKQFESLANEMNEYYSNPNQTDLPPIGIDYLTEGSYFACKERDNLWHRVTIHKILNCGTLSVYHVDYGSMTIAPSENLRILMPQFRKLPAQAIKSGLAGISPVNKDWDFSDTKRFNELTRNKILNATILESNEIIVRTRLCEKIGDLEIDIADILVKDGRAINDYEDL